MPDILTESGLPILTESGFYVLTETGPIIPAVPNGRWGLFISPVEQSMLYLYRWQPSDLLYPLVGEVGFTIFWATYQTIPIGAGAFLIQPSGAVVEIDPGLTYLVGPAFCTLEALPVCTVLAYVSMAGDFPTIGTYQFGVSGLPNTAQIQVLSL